MFMFSKLLTFRYHKESCGAKVSGKDEHAETLVPKAYG